MATTTVLANHQLKFGNAQQQSPKPRTTGNWNNTRANNTSSWSNNKRATTGAQ